MKVKTQHCLIQLGPMTNISKTVYAWESDVYEEKFGGRCEFLEQGETEIPELPGVGEEYSRLQDAHGIDEDTKVSHVENAFGRGKAGMKQLEKAMNDAVVKAKKPKVSKKKVAKKKVSAEAAETEKESVVDPLA